MVQPKTPPISFRPSAELLAEIDAIAERRKLKRHATILRLLAEAAAADRGLKPVVSVSAPLLERRAFNPQPKGGKKP